MRTGHRWVRLSPETFTLLKYNRENVGGQELAVEAASGAVMVTVVEFAGFLKRSGYKGEKYSQAEPRKEGLCLRLSTHRLRER
jgi:hypothetical protein